MLLGMPQVPGGHLSCPTHDPLIESKINMAHRTILTERQRADLFDLPTLPRQWKSLQTAGSLPLGAG